MPPGRFKQLLGVMIISATDNHIGMKSVVMGRYCFNFSVPNIYFFDFVIKNKAYTKTGSQCMHGFYYIKHPVLGIPGSQNKISIVHEIIEGGNVTWFGAKEEHRKFKDIDDVGMFEQAPNLLPDAFNKKACIENGFSSNQFQR